MTPIEKYARAAASTARTPPNSPARTAALEAENAARLEAGQFVKGLEAERDELRERLSDAERKGAEVMREQAAVAAWSCGMDRHAQRRGIPEEAREVGSFCAQAIRALPLPPEHKSYSRLGQAGR